MPTLAPPQIWSRKLRLLPSSRSRVYIATLVLLAVPITLMPSKHLFLTISPSRTLPLQFYAFYRL